MLAIETTLAASAHRVFPIGAAATDERPEGEPDQIRRFAHLEGRARHHAA
jgi:hypothetical protein